MALPWSEPGWLGEVSAWIDGRVERTGPIEELHRRALRSAAAAFELEPGALYLERLLDAYLEPWTALAPRERLRALFPNAYRLGMLNRALS